MTLSFISSHYSYFHDHLALNDSKAISEKERFWFPGLGLPDILVQGRKGEMHWYLISPMQISIPK